MARKISYSILCTRIERNIKGLVARKSLAKGLTNDLAETFEDIQRLMRDLKLITGEGSKRQEVKDALMSVGAWAWHTADHLNNIHTILMDEY